MFCHVIVNVDNFTVVQYDKAGRVTLKVQLYVSDCKFFYVTSSILKVYSIDTILYW